MLRGRIASQREDVLDGRFGVAVEDRGDLVQVVTNARQVRDGRQHRLALNPHDQVVRALAGRAARAVGHRDERRLQSLELGDRGEQLVRGLVGLGGKELEAEGGGAGLEDVLDVHGNLDIAPTAGSDRRRRA